MKNIFKISFLVALALVVMQSCQQPGGNSTGSEYIPDMAHSVAIEANTYDYFYYNRWGTKDEYHALVSPRLPVKGSVPRTDATDLLTQTNDGLNSHYGKSIPANGSVTYPYADTEDGRTAAMAGILSNPFPITEKGLAKGKNLYNIYCAICHGEKGDGAGYLVRDDGGKYPVQPANFLLEEQVAATNGRYYHAVYFGRNLMGSYKDKLSYEERWDVIHYIRSLQAGSLKLVYNEKDNTLNSVDMPYAKVKSKMSADTTMEATAIEVVTPASEHTETEHH